MNQPSDSLTLRQLLVVLRRRAPLIVLCTAVVALAAFAFTKAQSRSYTATASVTFETSPLSGQLAGLAPNSINPLVQQAAEVQLMQLGDMAESTARALGRGLTERHVQESLTVKGLGESNAIGVTASASSPTLAAQIANTYVKQFVAEQVAGNVNYFQHALSLVEHQLTQLPRAQRFGPAAVPLQVRAQDLRLLAKLGYGEVKVAQQATPPLSASSPHVSRNLALGALLGLMIGLGIALLLEQLARDRFLATPAELGAIFRAPLLGVLRHRRSLRSARSGDAAVGVGPWQPEVFDLIRARLRAFGAQAEPQVLLVTSACDGEGSSTVAANLAAASMRLGGRVLLIAADLRRSSETNAGQDDRPRPGLQALLAGRASLDEVVEPLQIGAASRASDIGCVDVVRPSGTTEHAGKLLAGPALSLLLAHARSLYDTVLIDAAPPLTVSDTWLLLDHVDGVVVVAQLGGARREHALALRDELDASRTPVLGVIATGARGEAARPGPHGFQPRAVDPHASTPAATNGHAPVAAPAVTSRGPV